MLINVEEINKRFMEFVEYIGYSQTKTAEYLGVHKSAINRIKNNTQSAVIYSEKLYNLGLNINWLISGNGKMLLKDIDYGNVMVEEFIISSVFDLENSFIEELYYNTQYNKEIYLKRNYKYYETRNDNMENNLGYIGYEYNGLINMSETKGLCVYRNEKPNYSAIYKYEIKNKKVKLNSLKSLDGMVIDISDIELLKKKISAILEIQVTSLLDIEETLKPTYYRTFDEERFNEIRKLKQFDKKEKTK